MTQGQKNRRFANALADHAAQALAAWEMRIPGAIETMDEIEFDWHYRHDPNDTTIRSAVLISEKIRAAAKQYLAEWA